MKHSLNTCSILGKFVLNIGNFWKFKKVSNSSHIWLKYRVNGELLELRSVSSSMLCILTLLHEIPYYYSVRKVIFWTCDNLHYQLALNAVFEKNTWEQTMETNLKALQGNFFKYDKQLFGIE